MHVAFVLPRSFPYRGGYENSLFALARYLVAHGHRATIFTTVADDLESFWLPGFKTFPQEQLTVDGVVIRRFPIDYDKLRRRTTRLLGLVPYWRWKAQYWRPSFRIPGLPEALRSSNVDMVHIGPLPYTNLMYYGLRGAELLRVPVVATPCTHLGEEGNDEVARHYVQPYQIDLLKRCAKVVCMTRTELGKLEEFGVTAEKLVIGHGIDLRNAIGGDPDYLRRSYAVEGPVVLHLGMKALDKGSQTLVEAMKLAWTRGSKAWLVMAGPSLSTFDDFIANAGKNCPRLLNLPPFGEAEKRDFLASATIVAQPSRVESLGLVLIEAWANSKPVIAADIAVSRELIASGGGGVTVPFGKPEQLAGAIENLLSDAALRQRMGAGGHEVASRYDGDTAWRRITTELERVAQSPRFTAGPEPAR